tara:strand:+ start:561 stop:968 length:408 start_codon:yes stop_codon:yes gene_type:complete
MAVFLSNDVQITVNSVNLTDHVASVSWEETSAELTTTAMGDANETRIGGLKDGSVTLELHQDFDASETYATLYALLGTVTTVTITPTSSAVSATNPKHSVSCLVTNVPLLDGSVSDLATISVTWPMSGAVTVATS